MCSRYGECELMLGAPIQILDVIDGFGISGEAINTLTAIYESNGELFTASSVNMDHMDRVIGVSLNSSIIGGSVRYRSLGKLIDPAINLVGKNLFFDHLGRLSTSQGIAFTQKIGTILKFNTVFIQISQGVKHG